MQTKQQNIFIWIAFTIISAIIIGGVGLYYYFIIQQATLEDSGKNYTVATQTTTTDETAGWRTFNNTDLGLSFKYPKEWQDITAEKNIGQRIEKGFQYSLFSQDNNDKILFSANLQSKDYQNPPPLLDYDGETIFSEKVTNGTLYANYWNSECSPNLNIFFEVSQSSEIYKKFTIYIPYDFYKDDKSVFEGSDPCDYKEPYTKIANKIKAGTYDKGDFKSKLELFKQIVKTVKFSK